MIKLSSRSHYGLRAMTELAKAYGTRPISLSEIAAVEHIPLPYLEQLVSPLRRSGLIEGTRGLHGGYRLTRSPAEVMVGEVVRILEGADATAPVECVADGYVDGSCARDGECLSKPLWARVRAAVDQVVDSISLADLCRAGATGPVPLNFMPEPTCPKENTVIAHG